VTHRTCVRRTGPRGGGLGALRTRQGRSRGHEAAISSGCASLRDAHGGFHQRASYEECEARANAPRCTSRVAWLPLLCALPDTESALLSPVSDISGITQ
jgi:hypothetical protein